ncbi:MAG: c-type cytochrome [Gammaproteobacteria bacterium]
MKKLTTALLALPLVAFSGAALAGDAEAGKAKADALYCMDCHAGEDFAGMSLEEIIEANKAVLSGKKPHPPGLEDMTEADIPDLSAYFYAEAGGE